MIGLVRGAVPLALATFVASCDGGTHSAAQGGPFASDGSVTPTVTVVAAPLCPTARGSEDLRPRADLTSTGGGAMGGGGQQVVHTADLFQRFRAACGACHVDQSLGNRRIANEQAFVATFDNTWLERIKTDDLVKVMPPPPTGKAWSMRQAGDSIFDLVTYLEAWMGAGRPAGVFPVGSTGPSSVSSADYSFTPDVAAALSNIGNCVPSRTAVAASTSGEMESLDTFFAGAQALPQTLAETDLISFDSLILANTRVVSFVPTYPLYSDGSGKLRHIRVPKGKTVAFNKAKQTFDIPPNTRFYKTFFRKVIDRAGHERNRKMETRLIVARPDGPPGSDGAGETRALFGTYVWNEDETMATLANLPYRDGTPFADQVRTYFTDELFYQGLVDKIGPTGQFDVRLEKALADDAVARKEAGKPTLQQHYAIPGRIRCVQCHMGSPTNNFVLGFFPMQIARREADTGGTYEPTGEDELNQLQRLIDYGVISGMTSPSDVVLLEKSQGTRKHRTYDELKAQGYLIGNCAHCHNPRGFPSISKPELAPVLDFLPDGKNA
ncbi:MAG: hypothetical protein H7X95_10720, partial [Deltaproteobacteria bacterium]|nr:hypothetical protein [Deltaproteobacteria bacterium]